MNNKGQVLVLFVILLPIILILLIGIIELGNIYLDKQKTNDEIKNIIKDNLKNYDETTNKKIEILIEKNIKDIEEKNIFTSEDEIRVYVKQNKNFFGKKLKIEYKIKGIKENENIKISEG